MGGGSPDPSLPDIAFMWMMYKAQACGLDFNQQAIKDSIHPSWSGELHGDLKGIYKYLSKHTRQVGAARFANQAVHREAVNRFESDTLVYRPSNLKKYLETPTHQVAELGPFAKVD